MKTTMKRSGASLLAAVFGLALASPSYGALLLHFAPDTAAPLPEVEWVNSGGGKEMNALSGADSLALTVYVPVALPGPLANYGGSVSGIGTAFTGASLAFTGWNTDGQAAGSTPVPLVGNYLSQSFNTVTVGTFELKTLDPAGPDGPEVLLKGTVTNGAIVGPEGGITASVQSNVVTYTEGAIYEAVRTFLGYAPGTPINGGTLSWSLINIRNGQNSPSSLALDGSNIRSFQGDMTGLFTSPIPEPTSLAVLSLGALGLLVRRRQA